MPASRDPTTFQATMTTTFLTTMSSFFRMKQTLNSRRRKTVCSETRYIKKCNINKKKLKLKIPTSPNNFPQSPFSYCKFCSWTKVLKMSEITMSELVDLKFSPVRDPALKSSLLPGGTCGPTRCRADRSKHERGRTGRTSFQMISDSEERSRCWNFM